MAYINNRHGKIVNVPKALGMQMCLKEPESKDPDTGQVMKRGNRWATDEEIAAHKERNIKSNARLLKNEEAAQRKQKGIIVIEKAETGAQVPAPTEEAANVERVEKVAAKEAADAEVKAADKANAAEVRDMSIKVE